MSNIPFKETIIGISTSHLTRETFEALEDLCPDPIAFICPEPEWGVVLRILPDYMDDSEGMPDDLMKLIEFAIDNDIGYIRLDRDHPVIVDLPIYNW